MIGGQNTSMASMAGGMCCMSASPFPAPPLSVCMYIGLCVGGEEGERDMYIDR